MCPTIAAGTLGVTRLLYCGSEHVSEQEEVIKAYYQRTIKIEIRIPSFTGLRRPEHIRAQKEVLQVDPSAAVKSALPSSRGACWPGAISESAPPTPSFAMKRREDVP